MAAPRLAIRPLLVATFGFGTAAVAAPPAYQVTDLGTLGGTASAASAINDAGDIVGTSFLTGDNDLRPFLYSNGVMQNLGTLGGDTFANGVNNARLIVGDSQVSPGGNNHGYYYDGTLHDIGTLGGPTSLLLGVNNAGDMAGLSDILGPTPDEDTTHAILYRNGQTTDLGTLGGPFSGATAINDRGQVVGFAALPPDPDPLISVRNHAFIWENGQMRSLGTLPGDTHSEAFGINELGQVVGTSETALGPTHAFLYDTDGVMKPLGSLPGGVSSFANGINDAGHIVGDAFVDPTTRHAFLYYQGQIYDLNDLIDDPVSGWELLSATAINNAGMIVGVGVIDGEEHAFVATPIPEPVIMWPAIGGMLWLGGRGCRWGKSARSGRYCPDGL